MTNSPIGTSPVRKPLRLWPGVALAVILALGWYAVPILVPDAGLYGLFAGLGAVLGILVWWLFFSRAPRGERWGAFVLILAALFATYRILDLSIATGAMGMLYYVYAVPLLGLALVAWAVATRGLSDGVRRAAMIATILVVCGVWALLRTDGVTGTFDSAFAWRWSQTPEERFLAAAQGDHDGTPRREPAPAAAAASWEGDWPGFRGPDRNGILRGVRISTDWSASPPVEVWRHPIGPGWSSFAVRGDRIYTQEQRGEEEVVACYQASTGGSLWVHRDTTRFWESNAGAGPRSTPTLSGGRVYTLGATGVVNALDAEDGAVLWSRNAASDTGVAVPHWGYSGSPLVVGDVLVVAVSGTLIAYDLAGGEQRWVGPAGGVSYSSPHRVALAEIEQVLLLSETGMTSVVPADGTVLWKYEWPGFGIVQPAVLADDELLMSAEFVGTRRVAVANGPGGWTIDEKWTSIGLKAYFNDFVVHDGHAYGFDGNRLACIDLDAGKRKWKSSPYGHGQLLLLADQNLLLVLAEKGELALVEASPEKFTEVARSPGIEGKTWNHPVLAGDLLLVRNDQEMAAYRLAAAGG
jgi:outer membrane protein assembly factor BamB